MVCRGLMLKLHRAGLIELPPVRYVPPNPLAERGQPRVVRVATQPLQVTLAEIRPLALRPVRRTPEEALFNSLLAQFHYLGYRQPVGEHLKYRVFARGRPIACLAWSSAPRHLGSRDRFIGWSVAARRKNICLLAYHTRFLILPWVTVAHLASHLLARMASVLAGDWARLYGHPIYFLETFIDPQRHPGTCYGRPTGSAWGIPPGGARMHPPGHPIVR